MKKILILGALNPVIEKERTILQRADLRIFTTTSGEEALRIHRSEKTDIIITELDMPGMCGDKLCSEIRKDEELKKVSIIMIGSNRKADIERSSKSGANSFLTKPVGNEELIRKVGEFLSIPERKSYRVLIKVEVKGKFMNTPFFCSSQDLSSSGILLETEKPLAKGDMISCSFFLPNSERIFSDGEVVRVVRRSLNIFRYGVRFLDIHPEYAVAISTFIRTWRQNS